MKSRAGRGLLALATCATVALADNTVITFDELTPRFWSGDEYTPLGVTFSTPAEFLLAADGSFDTEPIFVAGSTNGDRANAPIIASFHLPDGSTGGVSSVSFRVIDYGGLEPWLALIFDVRGRVLDTIVADGGAFEDPFEVAFTRAYPDIHRVMFVPSADYEGIDTLSFGVVRSCMADFNEDGSVDTLDVLAFLDAWTVGDASADVNGDGDVNTLDVLGFFGLWGAGCE